jgi:hypothetical protein
LLNPHQRIIEGQTGNTENLHYDVFTLVFALVGMPIVDCPDLHKMRDRNWGNVMKDISVWT